MFYNIDPSKQPLLSTFSTLSSNPGTFNNSSSTSTSNYYFVYHNFLFKCDTISKKLKCTETDRGKKESEKVTETEKKQRATDRER